MNESKRPGRPRGRRFVPISISVTQEQAQCLARERNASQIIRDMLDAMMVAENLTPEYKAELAKVARRDALKEEWDKLDSKRMGLISKNKLHFKGKWYDSGVHRNWTVDEENLVPVDREGEIRKVELDAIEAEMRRIEEKLKVVEGELLSGREK